MTVWPARSTTRASPGIGAPARQDRLDPTVADEQRSIDQDRRRPACRRAVRRARRSDGRPWSARSSSCRQPSRSSAGLAVRLDCRLQLATSLPPGDSHGRHHQPGTRPQADDRHHHDRTTDRPAPAGSRSSFFNFDGRLYISGMPEPAPAELAGEPRGAPGVHVPPQGPGPRGPAGDGPRDHRSRASGATILARVARAWRRTDSTRWSPTAR